MLVQALTPSILKHRRTFRVLVMVLEHVVNGGLNISGWLLFKRLAPLPWLPEYQAQAVR